MFSYMVNEPRLKSLKQPIKLMWASTFPFHWLLFRNKSIPDIKEEEWVGGGKRWVSYT